MYVDPSHNQLNNVQCLPSSSNRSPLPKSVLSIVIQNIRSMRENFNEFICAIQSNLPDIIVLTEIWINSHEVDLFGLNGYTCISNCNDNYRAGGVLVYIKTCYEYTIPDIDIEMGTADTLSTIIHTGNDSIHLIIVYRLHAHNCSDFTLELDNYLTKCTDNNLILCGDMNLDILKNTSQASEYRDMLSGHGLKSLINTPTRQIANSKTCIDHLFIRMTSQFNVHDIKNYATGLTDHNQITLSLNYNNPTKNIDLSKCTTRYDYPKIISTIALTDWETTLNHISSNDSTELFIKILSQIVSTHSKVKRIRNFKLIQPWINNKLNNKIKTKNKLLKRYRKSNWNPKKLLEYRKYCKNLKEEIATARK